MKTSESMTDTTAASLSSGTTAQKGLKISRIFTRPGEDPFASVLWERRRAEIKNDKGAVVFSMDDVECPATWSQTALDIAADKYFRKAGVPLANGTTGAETSVRAMISRVVLAIRKAGERFGGYFATPEDAQVFSDELAYMLLHQYAAFNSPVFFSAGISEAYGINGKPSGNWFFDSVLGAVREADDMYAHPAISACFIVSIQDDLIDIARHVEREMRIFRGGGGAGSDYSDLRAEGEPLSNGGVSSGLMSWLEIYDKAAGATKSGGGTRRAAKILILDVSHPDIEKFVEWKAKEEDKALALIKAGYPSDFNGEAYRTVSGQQANNSVRVPDEFMDAVILKSGWNTTWRTSGKIASTLQADKLFRKIAQAAHRCADPGLQFDTTINKWHTTPKAGRIRASNPCAEFLHLQDSACNLASINLVKFLSRNNTFDVPSFKHACRVFTLAQEILVDHASYPTQKIAQNSHDFRQLGLGYANLGALLMIQGIPYNSPKGFGTAGAITAILTGTGYETSAEIAASKGAFHGFASNRDEMLHVMNMHEAATREIDAECPRYLKDAAGAVWHDAVSLGQRHGYRNAQASVIAPAGTIGFLMDCDTTGVEPDFSLVKGKKMAGGGFLAILNRSVGRALETLGYTPAQVGPIVKYLIGTRTLDGAQPINKTTLAKVLSFSEFVEAESMLPSSENLRHVFEKLKRKDALSGFTASEIDEASDVIFGRMTIEGAPGLRPEHLPVFDCANKAGKGERFIEPMGHIKMLEAVQPFVSGSISKTTNVPTETTVEEIEHLYMEAWKRGLKCIAIYRDKSKHSQPLSSGTGEKKNEKKAETKTEAKEVRSVEAPPQTIRHRLAERRAGGFTQELVVGGMKFYIRTGEYADGSPGELFIDVNKEGTTLKGALASFAIAVSLGLQHGVPLEELVDAFTFQKFEPAGVVRGHPTVKLATSIIDAIFRVLAVEYMGEAGAEYAQVKGAALEELKEAHDVPASKTTPNGRGKTSKVLRSVVEGGLCSRCGGLLVRSGTCSTCNACGTSTGGCG